jgi:hypothetical protein
MIYSTDVSAKILAAMESVAISNNGWAWIKNDAELIKGLRLAGYVVIETGAETKAFSRSGWNAMAEDYKARSPASQGQDGPDYEAAILARQERFINY